MQNSLENGLVKHPSEIQQIIEHINVIIKGSNYIQYDTKGQESLRRL